MGSQCDPFEEGLACPTNKRHRSAPIFWDRWKILLPLSVPLRLVYVLEEPSRQWFKGKYCGKSLRAAAYQAASWEYIVDNTCLALRHANRTDAGYKRGQSASNCSGSRERQPHAGVIHVGTSFCQPLCGIHRGRSAIAVTLGDGRSVAKADF